MTIRRDRPLPIDEALPALTAALRASNVAVLVAPPGAGKTTRVPLVLNGEPWATGKILVLEPRRIAARAAADRMAKTLDERTGDTVGLRVRFGSKVSAKTRIEVVTEGVFTRLILDDPELKGVAAVLFDEFHERSLDADLGLALARDAQQGLREDLKILVMSATIDGARVAALLGRRAGDREPGPRLSGRDALPRPRSARAHRGPDDRRRHARAARRAGIGAGVPAGRRRNPPHRDVAERARRCRNRRGRAVRRARRRDAGPRDLARAGGPPQGRARHVDCRDLAHHRGRAHRGRFRPRARAALRARRRPDPARNRARLARRRRPAPRPRRAHRAGRLLSAVGRAADRLARGLRAAGNPLVRSVLLRARPRGLGRGAGVAVVPRSAAEGCARGGARAAHRARRARRRPHHGGRPCAAPPAAAAATGPHGGRCGARGRGRACGRHRRGADRARARRRRCGSDASCREFPPRSFAPCRRCARDGEALGRTGRRRGGRHERRRDPLARLSGSHREEPRQRRRSRSRTGAAAMSIRPRRWRASRSSRSPS